MLRPDNAVFVQAYERKSAQTQIELHMEVDHRRVARLDAARGGGGLDLELQLTGHVVDANGRVYRVWDRVDVSVSQSGWVDILRDIGFSERLLLEVPVIGERLESVAGPTIVAAAEAFQAGRWRDCVGKCRAALDDLTRALGDDGRSGPWGNKTMSKQERLLLIRQALYRFASPAVHHDEIAASIKFGPEDARVALAMTAAIVQWASDQPQELVVSVEASGVTGSSETTANQASKAYEPVEKSIQGGRVEGS